MLSYVMSVAVGRLGVVPVEVEVDITSQELPSFTIVGLADKAVDEARERVRSTIKKSGADFSVKFMLVAAQNLYPCGYLGDNTRICIDTASQISRYQKPILDPLLDRIDIHPHVQTEKVDKLTYVDNHVENFQDIRIRVQSTRDLQTKRFKTKNILSNAVLSTTEIKEFCPLSKECLDLLKKAATAMRLSARLYHRSIKLA